MYNLKFRKTPYLRKRLDEILKEIELEKLLARRYYNSDPIARLRYDSKYFEVFFNPRVSSLYVLADSIVRILKDR
jgi:hypothetical protein